VRLVPCVHYSLIHSTAAAEATAIYHIRILQHIIINVFNIIRRSKTQVKMEYTMSGIYNIMVPYIGTLSSSVPYGWMSNLWNSASDLRRAGR